MRTKFFWKKVSRCDAGGLALVYQLGGTIANLGQRGPADDVILQPLLILVLDNGLGEVHEKMLVELRQARALFLVTMLSAIEFQLGLRTAGLQERCRATFRLRGWRKFQMISLSLLASLFATTTGVPLGFRLCSDRLAKWLQEN